jgi:two-component system alkaline phosphatase synthesis response regulator PhoP
MSSKILIIDDEPDIRVLIKYTLEKEGYLVEVAEDGEEGIKKAKANVPDLIILDVMMPGMDGMETCERLREDSLFDSTFICFLTARSEDYSQIAGFESGGDDYISKPVKPKVLASRIAGILRRKTKSNKDIKNSTENNTDLFIDKNKFIILFKGEEVVLPRKEFKLLVLLHDNFENVCTREEILDKIWGSDVVVGDRTIDVHIRKLREKFGSDRITTIKGIGYKMVNLN